MTAVRVEAEAPLPTRHGAFRVMVFRQGAEPNEHVALVRGGGDGPISLGREPLVRVHSECIPSEVFGSLQCDCAHQLESALAMIDREGSGAVIYLRQEGRGIGLVDKVRGYALQAADASVEDTSPERRSPDEARRYEAAASMLRALGAERIRLITNSPEKARALRELGIDVAAVVSSAS